MPTSSSSSTRQAVSTEKEQEKSLVFSERSVGLLTKSLAQFNKINAQSAPIKPEVEIVKPDSTLQQFQEKENTDPSCALCSISNVPQNRTEPVRVYSRIEVDLTKESFYGNKILDGENFPDLRGIDFTQALKNYVSRYGERRYFYKRVAAADSSLSNIHGNSTEQQMLSLLTQKALYQMLYGHRESTADFKQRVLGWHDSSDGQSNAIHSGSPYSPEILDNILHTMPGLIEAVKGSLITQLQAQREHYLHIFQNQRNESGYLIGTEDVNLQNKIALVRLMYQELGTADLSEKTHVGYIEYVSRGITRIRQNTDFPPYTRIDGWVSGAEDLIPDLDFILSRLTHINNTHLKKLRDQFGSNWYIPGFVSNVQFSNLQDKLITFKIYGPFVELLNMVLNHLTKDITPEIRAQIQRLDQEMATTVHALNKISWCMKMVEENVVTDQAINLLADRLKANSSSRLVITDSFVPLVLEPATGPYQETPDQRYVFRPMPDSRRHNYDEYMPETGLISEYSMQVSHQRFGYGKHLYSQSLFPGEEVNLEMSTKSKREVEITTNSSEKIFEDATSETSKDFNQELNNEFSKTSDRAKKDNFSASASISASYFGASVSGSISSASESSIQVNEVAKALENTTDKLATKLSDQRQVTFEQSSGYKALSVDETEEKTTRKFVNINKDRTLTFNFFQITREYLSTLYLDEIRFLYSSGRYRLATIFVPPGFNPSLSKDKSKAYQELQKVINNMSKEGVTWQSLVDRKIVRHLPGEVVDAFPPDSLVILFHPPYHEIMPLAITNFFLATTFDKEKNAVFAINHSIWRFLGNGTVSPEGLGVSAFPKPEGEFEKWPSTGGRRSPHTQIFKSEKKVVADRVKVTGVAKKSYEFELANIDLCYSRVRHFRSRYTDTTGERDTLPLAIFSKTHVINTEGVYCENMLGQCSALEEFASEHRQLDVEAKRISNAQARLMTPPDRADFKGEDGETDFETYAKAVAQYEKIVKANRPEILASTNETPLS